MLKVRLPRHREGEPAMKKHRIILSIALLVLALGTSGSQFAQNALSQSERTNQQSPDHVLTINFLRTINGAEAANFSEHATYESWPDLVAYQSDYLNGWLATYHPNAHFGEFPGVLPGLKLRLNVHTDGHGYDVLLEDASDKTGYAAISDERGIIRECKWLQ
jgi:hypothetical protein